MTTTRWMIWAFWAVILIVGAVYAVQAILAPTPTPVPEKHWFPPPLPTANAPTPNADVRLTHYVVHAAPGAMSFTTDVTVKNFGQKKATGIQVRIQPYVGNTDSIRSQPGPDEIPNHAGGDTMANVVQWVGFPDLDPGKTATQTLAFPMRSDADPAQSFKPQINFQTVNP